jgi:hypothetical protein
VLNNLRATLFNDQPLLSECLSKPLGAAFIPILHCVSTALYVSEGHPLSCDVAKVSMEQTPFDLPLEDVSLQLNQFHANTRNLLDECYRHTLANSVIGPGSIIMHLAMEMKESRMPKSLRKIGNTYNIPDQQLLRRSIDENLYLILIQHKKVKDKLVLAYCTPRWLREFVFDPNRSKLLFHLLDHRSSR